jgi:prepilin-type N-terminal cleavage/methylation domain-containing protein/prepilin-type processing-associated H-X9-DG protein
MRRPPSRAGFTLIELLVVIAIIAILIGLLVPAVQKVREAAARAQCQNNLKQLGLALHAHHDTKKTLPAGAYNQSASATNQTGGTTWLVHILPFVEQAAIHKQYDFTKNYNDASNVNLAVGNLKVPIYYCPSGSQALSGNSGEAFNGIRNFSCHYYGNMGPADTTNPHTITIGGQTFSYPVGTPNNNGQNSQAGVLTAQTNFSTATVRLVDILDGTSNTIMVGERSITETPPAAPNAGYRSWVRGQNGGAGASKNVRYKINEQPNGNYNGSNNFNDMAFASNHSGGAQVLMGDGSARFLADSTDLLILKASASRASGEAVQLP